jgi:hypothetical protein
MQQLRLDELLRYCLSGGIGLVVFAASFRGVLDKLANLTGNRPELITTQGAAVLGVSLLTGALVYSLHRALIYPLVYRAWTLILCWRIYRFHSSYLLPLFASPLEVSLDLLRWKRRKDSHYFAAGQSEWGAQVHFLYCSTWAIVAALVVGRALGFEPSVFQRGFFWIALLSLTAAFASNGRLIYYDALLARGQLAEERPSRNELFKAP